MAEAIAARLRAEPGWRAVTCHVPLQATVRGETTVHFKVIHFVEWAVDRFGKLWPIGEHGRLVPEMQLVKLVEPDDDRSDQDLMGEVRDELQAKVREYEASQHKSDDTKEGA